MHSSSLQRDSHAIRMDQEEGLPAAVQKSPYHPAVIPGTNLAPRDVGSPHLTPGKFTMTDPMQPAQAYRPWHDFGQLSTLSPFAGVDFVG